jgi:hypothetical protein
MRWEYKPKTIYDRIKKRFALIPVTINNQWVWLESYYVFSWEDYAGIHSVRFNTHEQAVNWVKSWDETAE